MVIWYVFNPLLYLYTKSAPTLVRFLYKKLGVPGIMALPWITLSLEKVSYDTLAAARGQDMYAEAQASSANSQPHGGFPSGGAMLPSWSLVPVRGEEDRLIFWIFGDKPRESTTHESTDAVGDDLDSRS